MEVEPESKPSPPPPANLAAVLEHAALMAKQLPSAADPSQLLQIHAALHTAHHRLSVFLSHHHPQPPPIPENSVSSAVGGSDEEGEPMQMEDDGEEEQISRAATTASAELRRSNDDESERVSFAAAAAEDFDPVATRLRSLDLIYQFHA